MFVEKKSVTKKSYGVKRKRMKGHLGTLELEGRREQVVVDGKELKLKVNVANNFKTLEFGGSSGTLHLFHDSSLEFGVAAKSSHLSFFGNSVFSGPLLGDFCIRDNNSNEHALKTS